MNKEEIIREILRFLRKKIGCSISSDQTIRHIVGRRLCNLSYDVAIGADLCKFLGINAWAQIPIQTPREIAHQAFQQKRNANTEKEEQCLIK